MIINEDLKKEVTQMVRELDEYTDKIRRYNYRFQRILYISFFSLVYTMLAFFTPFLLSDHSSLFLNCYMVVVSLLFSIISLYNILRIRLLLKNYNVIYSISYKLMSNLADKTEWSKLRKKYLLGNKNYKECIAIENYILTIESVFSPRRSVLNFFQIAYMGYQIVFIILLILMMILFDFKEDLLLLGIDKFNELFGK